MVIYYSVQKVYWFKAFLLFGTESVLPRDKNNCFLVKTSTESVPLPVQKVYSQKTFK